MKTDTPVTIKLSEYTKPSHSVSDIYLTFDLDFEDTLVLSRMTLATDDPSQEIRLNGEELKLVGIKVDGAALNDDQYQVSENELIIKGQGKKEFVLEIENRINPAANKALDGLYKSGDIFCTQNEAEGFRRITYYFDRPDVMSIFTTKIIADKKEFPILLSNGNMIESGDLDNGKHFCVWNDPFPKPCYLYALVAGDLGMIQDYYTTIGGRKVDLRIYCDKGNESKCDHAMESLKKSMKWDEDTYGLEYDLDIYMIVAVDSFNMGAMENKGLNIFNSAYVLADQQTATDHDFMGIESVIGHEYFHNWTGNRVTCRDWFQLTLKEGLTVYRDQEFSSDLNSRTVQRVQDVDVLRMAQFTEDAGPTSHPIKPSSYMEINNFYTATIYNKGAEVIRMFEAFLGKDGFRKGMDKYFELFDGQAVTTEDFVHAMSVANDNFDFEQFKRWYSQSGTPTVKIEESFDSGNYTLKVKQVLSDSPGQPASTKRAHHFPLNFALLDSSGKELSVGSHVLEMKEMEQEFLFECTEKPVLSINRGFSAPVNIDMDRSLEELLFLMKFDQDGFNRVEAAKNVYLAMIDSLKNNKEALSDDFIPAVKSVLSDSKIDAFYKSLMLSLPAYSLVEQQYSEVNPVELVMLRKELMKVITEKCATELMDVYKSNYVKDSFSLDGNSMGKRALCGTILAFFSVSEKEDLKSIIKDHFVNANNMTDKMSSLASLSEVGGELFKSASDRFYNDYADNTLVMQKWLTVVAGSRLERDEIKTCTENLERNPVYNNDVPNLVRSLWGGFMRNTEAFHDESGIGYELMASKIIEVDVINPQMASRLCGAFRVFKKLEPVRQKLMKAQLERILKVENLSKMFLKLLI